jgi:hypothetical protein
MTWLARFLAWATLLSVPSFLLMKPYQSALAQAAMGFLVSLRLPVQLELRLQEPFNLGIFAAMCLASVRSSTRERVRALLVGVPALALFGLFTVVAVIGGYRLVTGSHGADADDATTRWILSAIETIPWVSAPALWLLLLGRRELPGALFR